MVRHIQLQFGVEPDSHFLLALMIVNKTFKSQNNQMWNYNLKIMQIIRVINVCT